MQNKTKQTITLDDYKFSVSSSDKMKGQFH